MNNRHMEDLQEVLVKIGRENPDLRDEASFILSHLEKEAVSLSSDFGRKLFSNDGYRDLRKALGKRVTPFLHFYLGLRPMYEGAKDPPEEGLYRRWRDVVKILLRRVDNDETKSLVKNLAKDAESILRKFERMDDVSKENSRSKILYKKLIPIIADMIVKAGKDQDVYFKKERLRQPGWIRFEKMGKEEKKLEKYKERDEELYQLAKEKKKLQDELEKNKEEKIQNAGLNPEKRVVADEFVTVGQDVQGNVEGKGKKRADDVWMLNDKMNENIDLDELDGPTIELELDLGGDSYKIEDYKKEGGNWYVKTSDKIDTKEWGNCKLRQKEVWVYDDDGDILPPDEFEEKQKREEEAKERLTRVMPNEDELDALRTYGTKTTGAGRRGNVSEHGLGDQVWVLKDKSGDWDPSTLVDGPVDAELILHLDDKEYTVEGWDTQIHAPPNSEERKFVYLEVDRPITNKKYGSYQLYEEDNILDQYKEDQEVEFRALTDDEDKQTSMTRIYPCIEVQGETVIAEGRYRGIALDDMINANGRMIEGTAYDYDPETGRPERLENVENAELRNPYISVNQEDDLQLRIPSRDEYTDLRNKVRDLVGGIPGMNYVEETQNTTFTFKPEHFRSIRDTVKSVSMSKAAREKIEAYFDQMRKDQNKFSDENLERYSGDRLGGFIEGFDFRDKQKEALAYLDGEEGFIGADTGTGKCVSPDTLVRTNRGSVQIEDLNPGIDTPDTTSLVEDDWEVYVDGEYLPVKRFYYGGEKPTNIVSTSKGFEVEATKVHPLLKADEEGLSWEETRSLEEGDYVAIHRDDGPDSFPDDNPKMEFPDTGEMNPRIESHDLPAEMTPELGRLFGYIIGEGWTNSDMRIDISQCPDENPEMHEDISNLLESNLKPVDASTRGKKDKTVSSKYIRKYLELNGIGKNKSAEKVVPQTVLEGTKGVVREFLKALFSAEGHVSQRGCFEFYTASEELAEQVQILLLKFGIVGSRGVKTVDGGTYYRLLVSGDDALKLKDRVGFIREDQKVAFSDASIGDSVNHDLIPHELASNLVEPIKEGLENSVDVGLSNPSSKVPTSLRTTMSNVIHQGRGLSYSKLGQLIELYDNLVDEEYYDSIFHSFLEDLLDRHIYFDKIESIEESSSVVMDVEVDHPSHTFIGNGFYNHNTLIAVGYIKDLMRKGVLENENDKVLFLCPASLEGNLESEIETFMENPDDMLKHVETMTYGQLSQKDIERVIENKGTDKDVIQGPDKGFIEDYEAVICDEASYLKGRTSDRSLFLQADNDRKVLLSASPMESDPIELFNLHAITENIDIQDYEGLRKRRKFAKRFGEKIGTKVVGVTQDPTEKQELVDWINVNMFQIDKTEMDDVDLPSLEREAEGISMPEEVEEKYRELTEEVEDVMRRMVGLYRDKNEDAYDPEVTGAMVQLKDLFGDLTRLQNRPDEVLDEVEENPKISRASSLIRSDIESGSRCLLWTNSSSFAEKTAKELSEDLPGTKHAFGTTDEITVYKNGEVFKQYTKRVYEDPETGERVDPSQWRQHVIEYFIKPVETDIVSITLTQSFSKGFNLQPFDQVIQLDRDDWNAENMKQRTARSWRQGQDNKVKETTLDMTYSERKDEYDRTLDEIRKYLQEMEEDLFQEFIKETQKETPGKAWFGMKKEPAELYDAERDVMEMVASPYIENQAELKKKINQQERK